MNIQNFSNGDISSNLPDIQNRDDTSGTRENIELTSDDIKTKLMEILANEDINIKIIDNKMNQSLIEMGLDSIKYIVLILTIEEEWDIQFDDEFHDNYQLLNFNKLLSAINNMTKSIKRK